jgi:hypothetical protein
MLNSYENGSRRDRWTHLFRQKFICETEAYLKRHLQLKENSMWRQRMWVMGASRHPKAIRFVGRWRA